MKKNTIINKIQKTLKELGMSSVSFSHDLNETLPNLGVNTFIQTIEFDSVTTVTYNNDGEEVDWGGMDLCEISNNTLEDILLSLETYSFDLEKTFQRSQSYNY